MFKALLVLAFSLIFLSCVRTSVLAVSNPISVPNNKFGIHIMDPVDLEDAAKLVNSSGGDWGYVTFVIRSDELDTKRWQQVFDNCRKLHLIPIVRVASSFENPNWLKLNPDEIDGWVSFFNSLNWVIKNRYIVVGNEPNHSEEWGGEVNPREYAAYLTVFTQKIKSTNDDYFILPAGFDASAPNSKTSMEESLYLRQMLAADPEIFNIIDGWVSHSYPNPAFSGSEYASGKGTIKTYDWELAYLKDLGVSKDLPVFITETGWINTNKDIANKFNYAFTNVWNDNRIISVTPFVLSYLQPPFDVFSWKDKTGGFFNFYNDIQNLPKVKGSPTQITQGKILTVLSQPIFFLSSSFSGLVVAENTGQSIWDTKNVTLKEDPTSDIVITETSLSQIQPNSVGVITFNAELTNKFPVIITFPSLMNLALKFDKIGEFPGQ